MNKIFLFAVLLLGLAEVSSADMVKEDTAEVAATFEVEFSADSAEQGIDELAVSGAALDESAAFDAAEVSVTEKSGGSIKAQVLGAVFFAFVVVVGVLIYFGIRTKKARRALSENPQSWEALIPAVHNALHRFGHKKYGRNLFSSKPRYSVFQSHCKKRWIITDPTDRLINRHAWFITINQTCTHFEVHYKEDRRHFVKAEGLCSNSLFAALLSASKHGPYRITRAPIGEWSKLTER